MGRFSADELKPIRFYSRNNGVQTDQQREVELLWDAYDTVSAPSMHFSAIVRARSQAETQSILTANEGIVIYESSFNMTGNGHCIGTIGQFSHNSGATVAAGYGLEGRIDMRGTGTMTIGAPLLLTTGNNFGTITNFYGIYQPDMSGLTGFANIGSSSRLSFYSATPTALMLNAGDIQTGGKYIATGVTSGTVTKVCQMQQHNSVNAGSEIEYVLNDGSKSKVGSFSHSLLSGTQADFIFQTLRGGTVQDAVKISGATLASGDTVAQLVCFDGTTTSLRRVTLGAVDSGGAGTRLLRVAN